MTTFENEYTLKDFIDTIIQPNNIDETEISFILGFKTEEERDTALIMCKREYPNLKCSGCGISVLQGYCFYINKDIEVV